MGLNYIDTLNKKEKEQQQKIMAPFSLAKQISKNSQTGYNGGYLFSQKMYRELVLDTL